MRASTLQQKYRIRPRNLSWYCVRRCWWRNHACVEPLVDCRCRRMHANGPWFGLRMERLSHSSLQGIWLEHYTNYLDIPHQLVFSGEQHGCRWLVDETQRP